jgi:4'-phosphopantetheinyl transferase
MMGNLSLGSTDVDLWYALTSAAADSELLGRYRELLPEDERASERRFALEKDRQRWLIARALLRTVLSCYAERDPRRWVFVRSALGKPRLAEPVDVPLSFNLSHTGGMVACAVASGHELGVDAEDTTRRLDYLALARRFFAPAEVAAIEGAAPAEQPAAFYRFWTLKEAYLKARGLGLSAPLGGFAFTLCGDRPPAVFFTNEDEDDPAAWQFAQIRLHEKYQLALAVRLGQSGRLRVTLRGVVPLEHQEPARLLSESLANDWRL